MTTSLTKIQTATTPLSMQEIHQYRNMVKSAIVLIVMWRLGRSSGASELSEILGIHRQTLAKYLDDLCLVGLATRIDQKDGYVLTNDGRQLMLQVPAGFVLDETHVQSFTQKQPLALTLHSDSQRASSTIELSGQMVDDRMSKFSTYKADTNGKEVDMSKKSTLNVENFDIAELLKKKEEDINYLKTKDSTSSIFNSFNVEKIDIEAIDWPALQLILESSEIILRNRETKKPEAVFVHGLKDVHPRMALAWIAQVYSEPGTLESPASTAYTRLKSRGQPKGKYYQNPMYYLPLDYLTAVGLQAYYVPVCDLCGLRDGHESGCPRSYSADELERVLAQSRDEIAKEKARQQAIEDRFDAVSEKIIQAWKSLLDTLQQEMARARFETWVCSTRPFDYADGILTVIAGNKYACDWLTSNILETAESLLAGFLGESVQIKFVTIGEAIA